VCYEAGRSRVKGFLCFWTNSMKIGVWLVIAAAVLVGGCTPPKSKVCEGCLGSELQQCEKAYESCDTISHCRRTDIKQKYADNICLGE
jgi:hypothetical protein